MNKRKHNVLLAAQQLFIEKGFQNTSIQDILDVAKISKGTFYNYFSSKNECLISILEIGREEADLIRREILIGKEASDKKVFAEQITILMKVNRERNLIPIFEVLYHSRDPELKRSVVDYHLKELQWLSKRLIDIYGQQLTPYSLDCGVLLSGMLQHFRIFWRATKPGFIDEKAIIQYVLNRLDDMIPHILQKDEKLLNDEIALYLNKNKKTKEFSKEVLLNQLVEFDNQLDRLENQKGRELVQFILKELQSNNPHLHVIEALLIAVRQAFNGTLHEEKVQHLTNYTWRYIEERM